MCVFVWSTFCQNGGFFFSCGLQIIHRFLSLPQGEQEHKKLDRLRFLDEEILKLQKKFRNHENTISDLTAALDFPIPSNLDRLSPQQLEDVSRQVKTKLHEVEEISDVTGTVPR